MEEKVITIINQIRLNKGLEPFSSLRPEDNLRRDVGFTSFDLAELTVRIENEFNIDIFENGLVNTLGEIFIKLR